jgi:tripartite-type tricarboxylate transporter receptor subunit TctC
MTMTKRKWTYASLALAAGMMTGVPAATADPVAEFFSGRALKLNVPSGAGGTYGLIAQIISRHMSRHIPGNPKITLQIMPGGLKATNYVYNVAAQDGSLFNLLSQSMAVRQVERPKGVKYDVRKFHPIGLITGLNGSFVVSNKHPVKTVADLKKHDIRVGTNHKSGYGYTTSTMLNHYYGTKIKIITGYKSGADSDLALERGEVDAKLSSWLSIKLRHPHWARGEGAHVILQIGYERAKDLPNVPTLIDLAKNDMEKKVFRFMSGNNAMARGLTAPPGVPKARVDAYRKAFDAMIKDPKFVAEMEKRQFPLNPKNWKDYGDIILELVNTPEDIVKEARKAYGKKKKKS